MDTHTTQGLRAWKAGKCENENKPTHKTNQQITCIRMHRPAQTRLTFAITHAHKRTDMHK